MKSVVARGKAFSDVSHSKTNYDFDYDSLLLKNTDNYLADLCVFGQWVLYTEIYIQRCTFWMHLQ